MTARVLLLAMASAALVALGAGSAVASVGDEFAQGRAIAAKLDAGSVSCSKLSGSDFEHLGEYVMERMVGSRSAHEAMNNRMESMMGSGYADRMHAALGRSFAGCGTTGSGGSMMGGGGMMGGSFGNGGGWGAMMGSRNWSWMRNGGWQHMTSGQWRQVGNSVLGPGMMGRASHGWSTAAIVALIVGALAVGGLVVFALVRRPGAQPPSSPSAAAQ